MNYIKVSFVLGESITQPFWLTSGHTSLGAAAYAADNICSGYFLGSGHKATVMTVTKEDPGESASSLDEIRQKIEEIIANTGGE